MTRTDKIRVLSVMEKINQGKIRGIKLKEKIIIGSELEGLGLNIE